MDTIKYKIIPNFLTKEEIYITTEYMKRQHYNNDKNFDLFQNNNGDTYFYKDPLIQVYLTSKKPIVEKIFGLELNESYSFWRCYTYNANLEKHIDRPACEYSVTVNVDSDQKWPIFMEGNSITLNKGDAVVYKGAEIEHWRDAFEGDYNMQFFLHYVDKNGKYKNHKGDEIHANFNRW